MPAILLVRHAQASFGGEDYDVLSELGHRQVAALEAELARRELRADRIVTGGLRRQRDTAVALGGAAAPQVDPRWDEYDATDVLGHHGERAASLEGDSGLSSRDFQVLLDHALVGWIGAGSGGGAREPWPAFRDRVHGALDDLCAALAPGEVAAVCTSGGVIAAVATALLDLPPAGFVAVNRVMANASITKLVHGRQGTSLVSFNEHSHVERDGLLSYR